MLVSSLLQPALPSQTGLRMIPALILPLVLVTGRASMTPQKAPGTSLLTSGDQGLLEMFTPSGQADAAASTTAKPLDKVPRCGDVSSLGIRRNLKSLLSKRKMYRRLSKTRVSASEDKMSDSFVQAMGPSQASNQPSAQTGNISTSQPSSLPEADSAESSSKVALNASSRSTNVPTAPSRLAPTCGERFEGFPASHATKRFLVTLSLSSLVCNHREHVCLWRSWSRLESWAELRMCREVSATSWRARA